MKWEGRRASSNVLDKRGVRTVGALGGGSLIFALIYALLGGDPRVILEQQTTQTQAPSAQSGAPDEQKEFVAVVLAETEDAWKQIFSRSGQTYREPKLVLFTGQVQSACGSASSAVGPFYCPRDQQVFLDLDFFATLSQRLGARGDFARAYVIAHEVGHHVQNLLGYSDRVQNQMAQSDKREANQLSVRLELQADCFAGVWAHETEKDKKILDEGDIEEAMNAAAAVGDDRLQEQSQGRVVPDAFTHGSSAQRMTWFSKGFSSGSMEACDTFRAGV